MSWYAFGQAGLLDSSFSNDGVVTNFEDGGAMSVAIQTDGKIVVGVYDGTEGFGVLRFNSDGSADNSFGGDGFSKTTIGLGFNNLTSIAIQADGKIIAGGNCIDFDGYNKAGLARFNADGSLDQSFNGGKFLYSYNSPPHYNHAADLAITSDQKIITAGVSVDNQYNSIFALARFNSNGLLDAGFGLNGIVWTTGITEYFEALDMAIQPDGGILVVGGACDDGPPCSFIALKYKANGVLDNTFGTGGIDTIFFGAAGSSGITYEADAAYCVESQDDGKFIMSGVSKLGIDTFNTIPVAKYYSNGTLDESFGVGGKVRIRFPNYKEPLAWDAVIDQHHNIILTGQCANNFSGGMTFTLRLCENGDMDTTFGEMGISYLAVDSMKGSFNWGRSVAIDTEQRIVVAGDSYNGVTVLRFLSGFEVGILNLIKADNPLLIYPNPVTDEARLKYQLLADEEISIMLYNLQSRLVQTFINRATRSKGNHEEVLKLNDSIVPGSYILQIDNGTYRQGIKIIIE